MNQNRSRLWHLAVVGVSVLVGALVLFFEDEPPSVIAAVAGVALYLLAWFTLGRRAIRREPNWQSVGYTVFLIVISGVLTSIDPTFATMQTVTFPLLWVVSSSVRAAIIANVLASISVTIGLVMSLGGGHGAVTEALFIGGLSLAFSIVIGLWISGVETRSEERGVLLDELRATQATLASLSRDAGIASERERLAREIHDTIAQDLTGLVMLAQQSRRSLASGDPATAEEELALLEENARLALGETRALVAATSPTALDDGGLGPALDRLAARFSKETGISVSAETDVTAPLDRAAEVVLLRCAQEGLANVRKHSGATSARLALRSTASGATLTVSDDGTGFDQNARGPGFGLSGMRERLALVEGSLEISSSPAGTRLTATLPPGTAS